jgi:hypothetical protein
MSIRLQTWAPFGVRIALNGGEWLKRLLDKAGIKYVREGNKFLDVENYSMARSLLDSQREARWIEMFCGFIPPVFPSMSGLLGERMSYTWTLWQSEWARDYIFHEPHVLETYMKPLPRHAFISGTSDRVLRYMGHPARPNGQPHWSADPEPLTRVNQWHDGTRVRHWLNKNSLKLYNQRNVLRFEFTMNDPGRFKIYRTVTGDEGGEKRFLPVRKGIADISARTRICGARLKSLTEQAAILEEDMSVGEILAGVLKPKRQEGKPYRGLEVTGKDSRLLRAIADPKYNASAITNKSLQKALGKPDWAKGLEGRKPASRISRQLKLLRVQGLIKKLPNQHKYMLTGKGRVLTTSLHQILEAKLSDLSKLAA